MEREEAIEVVKKNWPDSRYTLLREALETLIPELHENENGKIREEMLVYLKRKTQNTLIPFSIANANRWISWLEKQRELPFVKDVIPGLPGLYFYDGERMHFQGSPAMEEKQKPQLYWHKIKAYEKLPCRAYIYKFAYEQENNFHGKATIHGCLIPNEPVTIGCDTWYLPVEDIKNLPKEDELNTTSSTKTDEQKLTWNEEEMKLLDLIINDYEKASKSFCGYDGKIGLLKAIRNGEYNLPKPAEWNEDWREEDIQTRFAFYTYKNDPSVLYLSNVFVEETSRNHGFGTRILRAAEKVAEIIGATTISLKVKQDSPANAWYRKNGYGYVAFEDGYDWLEKNLEYMKPNKQEWSDEDEENFKWFDKFFRAESVVLGGKDIPQDKYLWFKSLRPQPKQEVPADTEVLTTKLVNLLKSYRIGEVTATGLANRIADTYGTQRYLDGLCDGEKGKWKPSEEQMKALNALNLYGNLSYVGQQNQLISLYQDLKKLM